MNFLFVYNCVDIMSLYLNLINTITIEWESIKCRFVVYRLFCAMYLLASLNIAHRMSTIKNAQNAAFIPLIATANFKILFI